MKSMWVKLTNGSNNALDFPFDSSTFGLQQVIKNLAQTVLLDANMSPHGVGHLAPDVRLNRSSQNRTNNINRHNNLLDLPVIGKVPDPTVGSGT